MPTNIPSFIIGYHGCDRELAEKVIAGETHLRVSKNRYDWLGNGIYFWENNPYRAFQWAKDHVGKTNARIKNPYAIGAVINPGNCLDLTEAKSIELIKQTYSTISAIADVENFELPRNQDVDGSSDFLVRNLDCFVINALHEIREETEDPFDTVRSPFFEGNRLYEGSGFREKSHVQICVRSSASILGYFRILQKDVFK